MRKTEIQTANALAANAAAQDAALADGVSVEDAAKAGAAAATAALKVPLSKKHAAADTPMDSPALSVTELGDLTRAGEVVRARRAALKKLERESFELHRKFYEATAAAEAAAAAAESEAAGAAADALRAAAEEAHEAAKRATKPIARARRELGELEQAIATARVDPGGATPDSYRLVLAAVTLAGEARLARADRDHARRAWRIVKRTRARRRAAVRDGATAEAIADEKAQLEAELAVATARQKKLGKHSIHRRATCLSATRAGEFLRRRQRAPPHAAAPHHFMLRPFRALPLPLFYTTADIGVRFQTSGHGAAGGGTSDGELIGARRAATRGAWTAALRAKHHRSTLELLGGYGSTFAFERLHAAATAAPRAVAKAAPRDATADDAADAATLDAATAADASGPPPQWADGMRQWCVVVARSVCFRRGSFRAGVSRGANGVLSSPARWVGGAS